MVPNRAQTRHLFTVSELEQGNSKSPCLTSAGNVNFIDSNFSLLCTYRGMTEKVPWVLLLGFKKKNFSEQANSQTQNLQIMRPDYITKNKKYMCLPVLEENMFLTFLYENEIWTESSIRSFKRRKALNTLGS